MGKYNWKEAVVIVTGASSGIGRAASLRLAQAGAFLALAARRQAELETLAREIRSLGSEAIVLPTDVTFQDQVQSMVQAVLQRWGRVDVLVSNAGQYVRAPITEMSFACLERSMAVNFYAGVYTIQAVLPHMLERRKGHIVLVSSTDVKTAIPPDAPYVAAKCALSGFGDILRQELCGTGVEVTTIYPGRIDTPMIENIRVPRISAKIPPESIARAIQSGVERRKAEVFIPANTRLFYIINVFFPRTCDCLTRKLGIAGEDL
jgi:NADP-dependent 3-hydroxy acid dehydrogenase YdfG